jgi:hypothetical protein
MVLLFKLYLSFLFLEQAYLYIQLKQPSNLLTNAEIVHIGFIKNNTILEIKTAVNESYNHYSICRKRKEIPFNNEDLFVIFYVINIIATFQLSKVR